MVGETAEIGNLVKITSSKKGELIIKNAKAHVNSST